MPSRQETTEETEGPDLTHGATESTEWMKVLYLSVSLWLRCSVPEVRCLCTLPLTLEENRRAVSDARADPVVGRRLHDQGRGRTRGVLRRRQGVQVRRQALVQGQGRERGCAD